MLSKDAVGDDGDDGSDNVDEGWSEDDDNDDDDGITCKGLGRNCC